MTLYSAINSDFQNLSKNKKYFLTFQARKGGALLTVYVISFTDNGDLLNKKICRIFKNCNIKSFPHTFKRDNLKKWTENAFADADAIIFIGAAGIAVRAIASYIDRKDKDPAVVVCDELGKYAVPILSGHIGGGNDIALKIEQGTSAKAVITTATDINGVWAVDNWAVKKNFKIANIENVKYISSALLRGEQIGLFSDVEIDENLPKNVVPGKLGANSGIVISPYKKKVYGYTLNLIPKCLSIGVGSKKNADENALIDLFEKIFRKNKLDKYSVSNIATIDLKKNEPAILKLQEYLNVELKYFTSDELNKVYGEFSKSEFVKSTTGTDNVCEKCAVLASDFGKKIIPKSIGDGVTLSVGLRGEVPKSETLDGGDKL